MKRRAIPDVIPEDIRSGVAVPVKLSHGET